MSRPVFPAEAPAARRAPLRLVTTSWDDGDPADLRVAELLGARGLAGTFYVPLVGYRGGPTLAAAGLRELASGGFEIGAHGVSHRTLRGLPPEELEHEVRASKSTLEQTLGREVGMFCYPRGRYDRRVRARVRTAGYRGARTTRLLGTRLDFQPYDMPASLQAFPHTGWAYVRNMAKARDAGRLWSYWRHGRGAADWVELGRRLFDRVLAEGGVWHLFGHSWEIAQRGLWAGLEELADYVRGRPGVLYATNREVLEMAGQRGAGGLQ
jgi:peptidoglycan/xylan/chitin deacetylase (PgdA/CDA1 family)